MSNLDIARSSPADQATWLARCVEREHQDEFFRIRTGVPAGKARELLAAVVLQRWLLTEPRPIPGATGIRLLNDATGIDAMLEGDVSCRRPIEFKSRKGPTDSFQLDTDFKCHEHGMPYFIDL